MKSKSFLGDLVFLYLKKHYCPKCDNSTNPTKNLFIITDKVGFKCPSCFFEINVAGLKNFERDKKCKKRNLE